MFLHQVINSRKVTERDCQKREIRGNMTGMNTLLPCIPTGPTRLLISGLVQATRNVLPISRYSSSRGNTNPSEGIVAADGDATLNNLDVDVACSAFQVARGSGARKPKGISQKRDCQR